MNPRSKHQQWKGKAVILLAGSLLALPAGLSAQEDLASELARLRAENARLREDVATTEAPPASAGSEMQAETTATRATEAGEEIIILSPFEISSDKDFGYLKTNAATASRIGMDVQNTPMSISVLSEDFVKDTGMQTITDVFRYTSSGSPDGRFEGQRPANEATPRGNFTMRGFKVNALLRNSVFRYTSYNLDNIDRVEVVKGPAAVFFGQGYPGGVVNYITKAPVFGEIPTTMSFYFGNNGTTGTILDHNQQLSEKAAFRIVGAWHADRGPRDGEYWDNWNATPSITFLPFDDGSLKIDLSLEVLEQKTNVTSHSSWGWIYPDEWFRDWSTPPDDQMRQVLGSAYDPENMEANVTGYRAKTRRSVRAWHNAKEALNGGEQLPLYTADGVKPGARYYDEGGSLIYDRNYNYAAGGSFSQNSVVTLQGQIQWSPVEWVDARYVYTQDRDRYDAVEGRTLQQADFTFNQTNGGGTTGYYRDTQNHQLDLVFKFDALGTKTKVLVGGVSNKYFQNYNANFQNTPIYWQVPGYNYPEVGAQEDSWGARIRPGYDTGWNVPVDQVLYDRNGDVRTPSDIYTKYDPGVDVRPDNAKVYPIDRNLLDGYKPELLAYYINLQSQVFDERLTLMLGYRKEESKGTGQWLQVNAPWFDFNQVGTPAGINQEQYPSNVWNYSPSYSVSNLGPIAERSGDSWNIGASWKINDENNIFVTVSKTFKLNFGYAGGFIGLRPDGELVVKEALDYAAYKGENGYDYQGTRITSVQQGLDVMDQRGAWDYIDNEEGFNYEIGWKTQMNDNKLVGTVSIFQGIRRNEKLDDAQAQTNDEEPYNRSTEGTTDLFSPGPSEAMPGAPAKSAYYNKRVFRWRTVGTENTVTGTEFEFIYTPVPNYQSVINGAWLWQAETTDHPTRKIGDGGIGDIYRGQRIENVPEFTFNWWNKYTFTESFARGLSVGIGLRYRSETIVSRSFDWNADKGGFTAGNYLVFDANISYPWQFGGYNFKNTLQITNLTDETYYEGSFFAADQRTWRLYTTLEF